MKVAIIAAVLSMVSAVPALAATFVYVSNAEDGDIGMYTLQPDGRCNPDRASRRKSWSCQ
jgi:6-phosphogluconolactonase